MTKQWHVSHPQELYDALNELRSIKLPVIVTASSQRPRDGLEKEKWGRLQAFLHRGVIPVFMNVTGYMKDEAKHNLQIRFALVEEHSDHYIVESVGHMSVKRLIKFIDDAQMFLVMTFGERANELLTENQNRLLKTKRIKK